MLEFIIKTQRTEFDLHTNLLIGGEDVEWETHAMSSHENYFAT